MFKIISNSEIAKVTIPLFFTVPPGSQIYDTISFLAFVDKRYEKVAELISKLNNYEELVERVLNGEHIGIDTDFNVEFVDEEEYQKKIEESFEKHKKILEVFEVKNSNFTFILFKSKFFKGGFEGFKKPIVIYIFKDFDEISLLRSYLLWKLVNEKKIENAKAEVMLDYVLLKYRLKIGQITKEKFNEWIKNYKKKDYWILKSFGDWIDKLDVLLNYDFNESVFEFLKKMHIK